MSLPSDLSTDQPEAEPASTPAYNQHIVTTAKGGGVLIVGRIFEYGGRLVLAFLLARLLGAEQFGLYTLGLTVATIAATIAIMGMDDGMMRFIAIYARQRDTNRLWGTMIFCLGTTTIMSVLLMVLLFSLAEPLATVIFHNESLTIMLRLTSLLVPFLALSEMLKFAARGFKMMHYNVIAENLVQTPIRIVLLAILGIVGLTPYMAVAVFGLSDICASIVLFYLINKKFSLRRSLRSGQFNARHIFSFSFPLWIADLLSTFRSNIQTVLLGSLSTLTSVGVFTVVGRVNLFGHMSYQSLIASVKPTIAELQATNEWKNLERLYQTTSRWGLTLNLPVFLLIVMYPRQILSIFGDSYESGVTALIVLACAELVNVATGICGSIIDMTGHNRIKLFNSFSIVVISIGTNLLLIPPYGVMGAAVAAFISIALINLMRLIEVWYLYRILPYNREFLKPVLAGLFALAAIWLTSNWLDGQDAIVFMLVQGLVVLSVYLGSIWLLGLSPDDRVIVDRVNRKTTALYTQGRAILKLR